ncbi:MAG: nicotinate-nicotinamide nucleotide adenylyltransferase [Deltaproteobacteria bacterium]|nr:nicotinate-nicotinamide nucleotide adenylyltransferase [Deltaproteobacteria bacterium]
MHSFGILGGSFNPIHIGHLRGAEEIRQRFSLDKVLFIPTFVPPHKTAESVLEYRHRKKMTAMAIQNNPGFILEDIEERLPAPSYTYRTLQALLEKYDSDTGLSFILEDIEERLPAPSYTYRTLQALLEKYDSDTGLSFILGEDDFAHINTWNSPSLIFSLCDMIVITRHITSENLEQLVPVDLKNEFWYKEKEGILMHKNGKKVYLSSLPVLDISSSGIRALVRQHRSIRYLTPDPVIEYIEKERLYY